MSIAADGHGRPGHPVSHAQVGTIARVLLRSVRMRDRLRGRGEPLRMVGWVGSPPRVALGDDVESV